MKVYFKEDDVIEREMLGYSGEAFCASYIINENGQQIPTNQLTEKEILSYAEEGIKMASAKRQNDIDQQIFKGPLVYDEAHEVLNLMTAVSGNYQPSLAGMKKIITLLNDQNSLVKNMAEAVLTNTANQAKYPQIMAVTEFKKGLAGDFSPVTNDELLAVTEEFYDIKTKREQQLSNGRTMQTFC